MAITAANSNRIVEQPSSRVMALFDQGKYKDASAQLKQEQIAIFKEHHNAMLAGWKKIKTYVSPLLFDLYYDKCYESQTHPNLIQDDKFPPDKEIYFRKVCIKAISTDGAKERYKEQVAASLKEKVQNFIKSSQSKRSNLESKLTTEGIQRFMADFPSLDFKELDIETISDSEADAAFNDLREKFYALASITLQHCADVIHALSNADNYLQMKRASKYKVTIETLIQRDLQNTLGRMEMVLKGADQEEYREKMLGGVARSGYALIGREIAVLRIYLGLNEEKLKQYFSGASEILDSAVDEVNKSITYCKPNILVSIQPDSPESLYQPNYKTIILNQCDTEDAAIDGLPTIKVVMYGVGGRELGSIQLGAEPIRYADEGSSGPTTVSNYGYESYPFELQLLGPDRVKAVRVNVTTSNALLKDKFNYTAELGVPKPQGFTSANLIQNQQG